MREYVNKKLNIKRLLELGDLDIRGSAANNEYLTANEFFKRVEDFLEVAPRYINTLSNITSQEPITIISSNNTSSTDPGTSEQDSVPYPELIELNQTLIGIGYYELTSDIENLIHSLLNEEIAKAESFAVNLLVKFSALYERISSVHIKKKFDLTPRGQDYGSTNILLSDALSYWDYEEETRKLRVLAVDDVAVVLHTVTSILSPYYEVYALKSSSQVESFLEEATPELFLLDIEMNELHGFELVPLIRKFETHKDTPIIFLTGNASYSNLKDAIALGACDFITKPIDKDILLEKISKYIVRKKTY